MKKHPFILASVVTLLLIAGLAILSSPVLAATLRVCLIAEGCTATSTKPTYGQLLVGNAQNGYDLIATSSLGISGTSYWTLTGSNIYNNNGGNVGINLTNPARSKLEIQATTTTAGSHPFTVWDSALTNIFDINGAGNVGIGSTTPLARLSVDTSSLASGVPVFAIGSSTASEMFIDQNHRVLFGTTANANSAFFKVANCTTGSSSDTCAEFHAPSSSPWAFKMYNDAFTPTTAVFAGFGYNSNQSGVGVGALAGDFLLASNGKLLFTTGNASNSSNSISMGNVGGSSSIGLGIGTTSPKLAYLTVATPMGTSGSVPNMFLIASSTGIATTTLFQVNTQGDTTITGANGASSAASAPLAGLIVNTASTIFNVSASGVSIHRAGTSNGSQLLIQGNNNALAAGNYAGILINTGISSTAGAGSFAALRINPTITVAQASGTGLNYLIASYDGTTASTSRGFYQMAGVGAFANNIGMGSTSPSAKLSVHAQNGDLNTTLFAIGSSTASATSTLFSVDNTGRAKIGYASSSPATIGGTIFDSFVDAGNVTTGETDLYSYTLPSNGMQVNGDKVVLYQSGTFVSSGTATRQIRAYFAGTMVFDSGALSISASAVWRLELTCIRVSSTVARCTGALNTSGASLAAYTTYTEVTSLNLQAAQIVKTTGQAGGVGAATNDIVAKMGYLDWKGAGN